MNTTVRHFLCVFVSLLSVNALFVSYAGSEPLDNWHVRNSPVALTLMSVTHGNSAYVAAGTSETVISSHNGVDWTTRYAGGHDGVFKGITYSNGMFVAVGGLTNVYGAVVTSPDGVSWTAAGLLPVDLLGVGYGNGIFIAVTADDLFLSGNGTDWTFQSGTLLIEHAYLGVSYGAGSFVALGDSVISTSPDGLFWTERMRGSFTFVRAAYGNGIFVAVGSRFTDPPLNRQIAPVLFTSADGVVWVQKELPASLPNVALQDVAYGNGVFMAVGGSGTIITSADGNVWTHRTSPVTGDLFGVGYANNTFVAVGRGGVILQSDQLSGSCTSIITPSLALQVPVINAGGVMVSADLQYEPGGTNDMVRLTRLDYLTGTEAFSGCQATTFICGETCRLHVPSAVFDNISYWMDLDYVPTTDGSIWLRIAGLGVN